MPPVPVTGKADFLPGCSLEAGEKRILYPAVTISWLDWLQEKGEPDSNWYDFAEERPVWTMWWFRISISAVCIGLVWIFSPTV